MSATNNGGPAFARPGFTERDTESQEGMSLRAYFAGQALAGVRANAQYQLNLQQTEVPREDAINAMVRDSVALADALIAELEKGA